MTTDAQERAAIVAEALTWLRTPYHEHARIKGAGVDCAQFLIAVYTTVLGFDEPAVGDYSIDWFLHSGAEKYLDGLAPFVCPIAHDIPEPGDIAVFQFGRAIAHAAIVTDWPNVVHADRAQGRVALESLAEGQPYRARLAGLFSLVRWQGVPVFNLAAETPQ